MNTGRIDKTKYFDVQETLKRHNKDRMISQVFANQGFPGRWTSVWYTDEALVLTWDRIRLSDKRIWKLSEKNSTKKDMKSKFNLFQYWSQNLEGFQFRWLKIKGNDADCPISTILLSNHLKLNLSRVSQSLNGFPSIPTARSSRGSQSGSYINGSNRGSNLSSHSNMTHMTGSGGSVDDTVKLRIVIILRRFLLEMIENKALSVGWIPGFLGFSTPGIET